MNYYSFYDLRHQTPSTSNRFSLTSSHSLHNIRARFKGKFYVQADGLQLLNAVWNAL